MIITNQTLQEQLEYSLRLGCMTDGLLLMFNMMIDRFWDKPSHTNYVFKEAAKQLTKSRLQNRWSDIDPTDECIVKSITCLITDTYKVVREYEIIKHHLGNN